MRLIDADELRTKAVNIFSDDGLGRSRKTVVDVYDIYGAKTIDAVPVVRCKDCKYAYAMDTDDFQTFYFCEYADRGNAVDPMDFCSEGEKK